MSERRRLHPAAMIGGSLRALPGAAAGLIGTITLARDDDVGFALPGVLLAVGLILLVMAAFTWIGWRRFTYELLPGEIVIEQGLLKRQRRVIPFDRVQDVAIERGLLARLIGTARVRIETGGSAADEGDLEMVSLDEAQRLRDTIRNRQGQRPAADQVAGQADEELIFAMAMPRLLLSGLLNFSLLFIALAYGALQYLDDFGILNLSKWVEREQARELVGSLGIRAVALLAGVTILFGFLTGIARTVARDFGFRLTAGEAGLRRRRGLFTLSEVLIPARRTQAARLDRRWLSGWLGFSSLSFQTLGADKKEGGVQVAAPFARADEIATVLTRLAFPRPHSPLPMRTPRRALLRRCGPWLALVPLVALLGLIRPDFAALAAVPALIALVQLIAWSKVRYGLADEALCVASGLIRRRTWVVPYDKLQTLTTSRGPLQRRLGLATVAIDTAGAPALDAPGIPDLFAADAEALAQTLLARFYVARAARKAEAAAAERAVTETVDIHPRPHGDQFSGSR